MGGRGRGSGTRRQRRTTVRELISAAAPLFLAFVLALGIVVHAVVDHGLAGALGHLIPTGTSLPALLVNVINNLPAVLVLLPRTTPVGTGAVLGVNIGPNLTYAGSLATVL